MKSIMIAISVILLIIPAWLSAAAPDLPQAEHASKQEEKQHIGTIKESRTGGKYIYLKLEENGKEVWVATLPAFIGGKVEVGDRVRYSGGVEMTDFRSKALDRTFEKILFITKINNVNAMPLKNFEEIPADSYHSKLVKQEKAMNLTPPTKGEIQKAADGWNIEEIFAEAEKLQDRKVTVRAKVVKISKNILQKNWITLQDGTGTPPDNKLSATTSGTADIGDIVIVTGILKRNVNLGAGYLYKVLIEEAEITK